MLKSIQQGEGDETNTGREKRPVAWPEMEVLLAASGGEGGMLAMGNKLGGSRRTERKTQRRRELLVAEKKGPLLPPAGGCLAMQMTKEDSTVTGQWLGDLAGERERKKGSGKRMVCVRERRE